MLTHGWVSVDNKHKLPGRGAPQEALLAARTPWGWCVSGRFGFSPAHSVALADKDKN
jgi:hypothetical protein